MTCNQYGRLVEGGHIFIYSGCSQEKYQPNTPYETNLNSLLSSIVASSSRTLYNLFAVGNATGSPPDSAAYGLYQCRGDLKPGDCSTCIAGLVSQIALLCPYTSGASLQLDGCFVRYEETDFLGILDNSLRYKKCSAGGDGGDGEFLRRRDGVLADLQGGAAAGFGVSAAGAVEGYAQCLGDLAAADCAACLGEAVVEVKSLCGAAAAGDVFLAQCYVRYWESGYYDDDSSGI
ncbi:cysteine-rich repeat secretory protein 15 [Phtheirospermum japonicum]|uniref:Cysteine-rich repeat secretory protein 15 n=1 Tax=Phtheirospermum japonicum TaxID=374723 RepID=A0A830CI42_9LAMI|nr:cysteine-rich repeat secretory protein 15 [Phtheirospermum japonicum]